MKYKINKIKISPRTAPFSASIETCNSLNPVLFFEFLHLTDTLNLKNTRSLNYCGKRRDPFLLRYSMICICGSFAVADPGGGQPPLPLLKLVKKRWPSRGVASFASHWGPLGHISGSATGFDTTCFDV